LIDFDLHEPIKWDECPSKYEVILNGAIFSGAKFVERPPPPELGTEITIRVKKTRFKLRPEQVAKWIALFGKITAMPDYEDASDQPSVKNDDVILKAVLRKHIPGILPAYGRRMMIQYPGQPILCGKCFEIGHIRKNCERPEPVKWSAFVKVVSQEKSVSRDMLGSWVDLLEKN